MKTTTDIAGSSIANFSIAVTFFRMGGFPLKFVDSREIDSVLGLR